MSPTILNDDEQHPKSSNSKSSIVTRSTRTTNSNSIIKRRQQQQQQQQNQHQSNDSMVAIWDLPEILLYQIAQFCSPPTERASFFCHKISVLCKDSYKTILMHDEKSVGLWDLVLQGDYGVKKDNHHRRRRSCKRLRRSPIDTVRDAHKLMIDNTEIAYFYLCELTSSSAKSKDCLTKMKLARLLDYYGPQLMFNKTLSSGGTFLVEVCRSRNTTPQTILKCCQELIEQRGALVNRTTNESSNSILTPLCVASVRAMPKVVEYLLSKGASTTIKCSGRLGNPKRTVRCTDSTPLEFTKAMLLAEENGGAKPSDLVDLKSCIRILQTPQGIDTQ